MKRLKTLAAALLAVCLLLTTVPFSFSLSAGTYKVKWDMLYIYSEPDGLSDSIGEITKGRIVEITEIKQGYGRAFFASMGFYGWVEMSGLESQDGYTVETDITGIRVTPPEKTEYIHTEEELDLTGMVVYAVHEDGTETEIKGYTVTADSFSDPGEKTVTVTYSPAGTGLKFTENFTVTVIPQPVSALTVITQPYKTVYKEHEIPDLTGLTVRVDFSDRASKTFTLDGMLADSDFSFSIDLTKPLEPGEQSIAITYKYKTFEAAVPITVTKRKLTNLTVITEPDSLTTYSKTDMPDLKGLTLLAEYDNGESQEVDYTDVTEKCTPSSFILGPGNKVTVEFEGMSVELSYTLAQNYITGLFVKTPTVMTFWLGFDIDLSGLQVYYKYADNSIVPVTDYTITPVDKATAGTQNIIVQAGGYSEVFSVFITPYYGKGDIDGSGKTDVTDARLTLRAAIGYIMVGGVTLTACDINENGKADVQDARMILRQAIGLEDFVGDAKVIMP